MKGIDVSSYQGEINWRIVKNNVDFAIIRLGYGDDVESQDDECFLNNVKGCIDNDIPFGVYLYSYAKNIAGNESIDSEVNHCLRKCSQTHSISLFQRYCSMQRQIPLLPPCYRWIILHHHTH